MTTLLLALIIGAAFGAVLQRVGASRYERILETLRLRNLTILKFMLLAIGIAAVGVGVLILLGAAHLSIKPLYVLGVLVGGLVFGVGFALSGYCPGTSLVACAEGKRDAFVAVGGGLVGALAFTLLFPVLDPLLIERADLGKATLASATGLSPGLAGILFGAVLIVLALWLPLVPGRARPRTDDATPLPQNT